MDHLPCRMLIALAWRYELSVARTASLELLSPSACFCEHQVQGGVYEHNNKTFCTGLAAHGWTGHTHCRQ